MLKLSRIGNGVSVHRWSVKGDKNGQCLAKVKKMISHYRPEVMVLQDYSAEPSRRCLRIRELIQGICRAGIK
ncbi:MAG: hypothetical protein JWR19_2513 [Pedosphaera sp.]|nr:hypothetical protein [Pedosphaera sp.]